MRTEKSGLTANTFSVILGHDNDAHLPEVQKRGLCRCHLANFLDCPKNGFWRFAGREDEKKAASVSREGHLPLGSFDPLVGVGTATRARTKLRRREGEEQAKQKK